MPLVTSSRITKNSGCSVAYWSKLDTSFPASAFSVKFFSGNWADFFLGTPYTREDISTGNVSSLSIIPSKPPIYPPPIMTSSGFLSLKIMSLFSSNTAILVNLISSFHV